MKRNGVAVMLSIILGATAFTTLSAEPNWAGEYADKKFLNGQAVFQMSIEQSGNAIQVSFDAAYNDAHGAAPDGGGLAKMTGKDTLQFKWEDSFYNSGTGTIKRAADGIIVSMKTSRVVEPRLPHILRRQHAPKAGEVVAQASCLPQDGFAVANLRGGSLAASLDDPAVETPASPTAKMAVLRAALNHRPESSDHFLQAATDLA